MVTDFSTDDKLAASNFARWFIGVLGSKSHILGNLTASDAPQKPKIGRIGQCSGQRAGQFVQQAGHM